MADHQEEEAKSGASDGKKPVAGKASAEGGASSKSQAMQMKLKKVLGYAVMGFAPVVALTALGIAVSVLLGNQSAHTQLHNDAVAIERLNSALAVSKIELERLKVAAAKESAAQNEKLKQQDGELMKLTQSIIPLQIKLKISPTLGDPVLPASLSEPQPAVVHPVPVKEKVVVHSPPEVSHKAIPKKAVKAAAVEPHAASAVAAPVKSSESSEADKKLSPQVLVMQDAIEKFNKK